MESSSNLSVVGEEEEMAISELKDFFLRLMLATGPGATNVALRADLGTIYSCIVNYVCKIIIKKLLVVQLEDFSKFLLWLLFSIFHPAGLIVDVFRKDFMEILVLLVPSMSKTST